MDKIVYVTIDNGIEGKNPDNILYATWDENHLKGLLNQDKSKAWRRTEKVIINEATARKQALAKLNGIDRLVLGLPNWIEEN